MDNYCAPQWVDFTSSPQVPSDDYFEKHHEIYEPKLCIKVTDEDINSTNEESEIIETPKKSMQSLNEYSMKSVSTENLETEMNNIKNTPIKVIYPLPYNNNKSKMIKQTSYDNILNEAMQNVQLCEEFINDKKDIKVSSMEDVFKKPMPVKKKIYKPVKVREIDNTLSDSADEQDATSNTLDEETNNMSTYGVNMFKRGSSSWKQVMKDVGNISKMNDSLKSNVSENDVLKNDRSKIHSDNTNLKLKSSGLKQKTSVVNKSTTTNLNSRNRTVAAISHKYLEKSKPKQVGKDQIKTKLVQSNSANSSLVLHNKVMQNNIRVTNADSTVKAKQPYKPYSSFSKEEKSFNQKNNASKKIVTTVVGNIGSEIIIKKEKILFFDIPIHTKQKKVTCPVPFSFENRDKLKKQLKLDQSESKCLKSKSVPNLKLLDFNKSQKVPNKLPITRKNTFTSFSNNKDINEKMKNIKQLDRSKNTSTAYVHSSISHKPMKTTNLMKDKVENKKITDNQNKKDANQIKRPLASIPCKNIQINTNLKNKTQESLKINKQNIQKENKQPNISKNISTLNQSKLIKPKTSAIKINVERKEKQRHVLEEKMKEKKMLLEEKLKKEKEEKEANEKLEIAKLRKQTEIKARPMPVYKPLIRIKSTKPLTKPQSPAWSSKRKVQSTL